MLARLRVFAPSVRNRSPRADHNMFCLFTSVGRFLLPAPPSVSIFPAPPRVRWQSDPGAGMDVLGLQGMIDNLPQTVDTTFSSNMNSPAIDFGVPKTGNYFNGSTDM